MSTNNLLQALLALLWAVSGFGCNYFPQNQNAEYPDLRIAGAMKNVMWKGELSGVITLDTIKPKDSLYGLGPESDLRGEILISNGNIYTSRIQGNGAMLVQESSDVTAPFFVYGWVNKWKEVVLPARIKHIKDLERFIDEQTTNLKRPFAFKLRGTVHQANIHVQNLPPGTPVSSPQEAHQGQVDFMLNQEKVEIVGFFSTRHQGIFTHHDSYLHMHLMTADKSKMGHLDGAEFGKMTLLLPTK